VEDAPLASSYPQCVETVEMLLQKYDELDVFCKGNDETAAHMRAASEALGSLDMSSPSSASHAEQKLEAAFSSMSEDIARGNAAGIQVGALKSKIVHKVVQAHKLNEKVNDEIYFWKELMRYAETRAQKHLYNFVRSLKLHTCGICLEDYALGVIFCQDCDSGAVCHGCVPDLIRNWCSEESSGDRLMSGGEVQCVHCRTSSYQWQDFFGILSPGAMARFVSKREDAKTTRACAEACTEERRKAVMQTGSVVEMQVDFCVLACNSLSTLRCPSCDQAFAEREEADCLAVQCSRCKTLFCGFCTEYAANDTDAHTHVAKCRWRPDG